MEFKETFSESLKRKYQVVVPSSVIESAFNKVIEDRIRSKSYPGFRIGKAPFSYVAKKEAEVIDSVIVDRVYKAWGELKKQENIVIFDHEEEIEDIDIDSYKNQKQDVRFTVKCELLPKLPEINFKDIVVKRKKFEVQEDEIREHIKKLKKEVWLFEDLKESYKAKKNDFIKIDCEGKINGKVFKGGTLNGFELQIGQNKLIKELEDGLIGMKLSEEKKIELTFPSDYHDVSVAGKLAVFDIVVKQLKKAVRPKTEEDLVKRLNYKDKEEFRKSVDEAVRRGCEQKINAQMRQQIEENLSKYDFAVPEALLERQKKILKEQKGKKVEDLDENEIVKTARLSLIFAKFASSYGLKLQKEDVINHLQSISAVTKMPPDYLLKMYQNVKDFAASTNLRIMEERIISKLIEVVKKEDVQSSVKEILKVNDKEKGNDLQNADENEEKPDNIEGEDEK